MVRENFRFGSGSKKFSRQNEKILAPVFQDSQTAIRAFDVRILKKADQLTLAYGPEHAGRTSLGKKTIYMDDCENCKRKQEKRLSSVSELTHILIDSAYAKLF